MEQTNSAPATPKDARKVTEEQQEEKAKLERQNDNPDAPGGHLDRHKMADET